MHALLLSLLLTAPPETVAATVNGEPILLAEVDAAIAAVTDVTRKNNTNLAQLRALELNDQIDFKLTKQYVLKHGPPSDPDELAKQVAILKESLKRRGSSLEKYLKNIGWSEARFHDNLDISIRFRQHLESKTTQAQYKAYYEANRDIFTGATVTVSQILIHMSATAAEGEAAAAGQTLAELRKDILAGRITFAAAARRYHPFKNASELGKLQRREPRIEEPILAAAFALQVGEVSAPVRTTQGVHLLTVTARTAGNATTFEKEQDNIKDEYAADAQANLVAELRKKATIVITLPK